MGKNYSFIYWSGSDLFMYTVTFPLRLVTFPGCTMNSSKATTLESKLGFSEIQGWDRRYFVASGKAGKLNLTGRCLMPYSEISLASFGFAILQRGPMGSILNFYWCVFRKK